MAETMEYRPELLFPAYEEIKRTNLATESGIREMEKRRVELEHKITERENTIKTYGEYIVYEKCFLKLLKKCENKFRPKGNEEKIESIENFIKKHVKSLFNQALQIFYSEIKLWDKYIKTLIEFEDFAEISSCYEKILQYHSDKPGVWLSAIEWEEKNTNDISKARQLLLQALQIHPENIDLHTEFLKILLIETGKMSTNLVLENNTASERDVGLRHIEAIYASSKEKLNDLKYLVKVLHYLEKYSYTNRIQRIVISDMMNLYPGKEETWHVLALRELKREITNEAGSIRTLPRRIELCCDVYESAVKTVKTVTMWELYIQTMIKLNRDTTCQESLKRRKLFNALADAYKNDLLPEKHFIVYIRLLERIGLHGKLIEEAKIKATTLYPRSKVLWRERMVHYVNKDDIVKIYHTFTEGIKFLQKRGYELWKILLRYYLTKPDLDLKINYIFRQAIRITDVKEFLDFRIKYLEWTFLKKDFLETRSLYDEMIISTPKYYELHEKMEYFESIAFEPNFDRWRVCYENMIKNFGEERIDVWIKYVTFEREFGSYENMAILHERATRTLKRSLLNRFSAEYAYARIEFF